GAVIDLRCYRGRTAPGYQHHRRRALLPIGVPMAGLEAPTAMMLDPVFRHPMRSASLAQEMAVNPHMPMTVPAVVAGSPNESRARWRCFDHSGWRRRDFYFDRGRENRTHCKKRNRGADHTNIHVTSTSV